MTIVAWAEGFGDVTLLHHRLRRMMVLDINLLMFVDDEFVLIWAVGEWPVVVTLICLAPGR